MNEIKIFENKEFGEVRTIKTGGKVLFCGSDIAKALGYAIPTKAINAHCRGVSKMEVPTYSGKQQMLFITEGDVYRLIVKSKLPAAERFENWVFDEVLPSIQNNGGYIANQEQMTPEQIVANALIVAQNIIDEKNKQIEQMKPKALFADCVTASETSILVREFAKILRQNGADMGEKRLYKWFRDNGYVIKNSCQPTQKSMEQGLFSAIFLQRKK